MKFNIIILLLLISVGFMSAQTQGTLTVRATTSNAGGEYAPSNIVAVWVVNSNGQFVKTLLRYANTRIQYLTNWNASTSTRNVVDAITGSTQNSHGIRTSTWNGRNVSGAVVADGVYTVKMELTDKNSTGNVGTFTFTKGPATQTLTPANVPSFSSISISWVPSTPTDLPNVELSELYSIYPNPTNSTIFVSGPEIQEIEIYTISGKSLLKTKLQSINLSTIPKGNYLVKVYTEKGEFIKKLTKN